MTGFEELQSFEGRRNFFKLLFQSLLTLFLPFHHVCPAGVMMNEEPAVELQRKNLTQIVNIYQLTLLFVSLTTVVITSKTTFEL